MENIDNKQDIDNTHKMEKNAKDTDHLLLLNDDENDIGVPDCVESCIENSNVTDVDLLEFLAELHREIENKTVNGETKQVVGQLYMAYKYHKQIGGQKEYFSEEDMYKFLFLGWYIYTMILNDKLK